MIDFKCHLENESYSLIQTEASHFDDLYRVAGNPVVWQQHPEQDRWKKENFTKFFQAALQNELGCFTILDKDLNAVIGSTRFYSYDEKGGAVRIGFTFISPEYWGSSTNAEIKKIMLNYVFQSLEKVYFDIGKENYRSRKATEKLGAVLCAEGNDGNVAYLLKKNARFMK